MSVGINSFLNFNKKKYLSYLFSNNMRNLKILLFTWVWEKEKKIKE